MSVVLPYLLSGISVGGQYALIAIGYTMVYGILRLINFAHGDVFMVAGVMMVYLSASLPLYISMPLMLILTVIIGFAIERAAYKPLRSAPRMSIMISAIGVSYLLQNGAQLLWTSNPKIYTSLIDVPAVHLFGGELTITGSALVTVISCLAVMALLLFITQKTKIGKAMRAVSEDKEAAQLMGINVNFTISVTFAIGSALAAVAGVLLCSSYPSLYPTLGSMTGIKAFTAAVFGGIGSIPGAFVGGILLGVIEKFAEGYISTQLSNAIVFSVLIIVLLVRPAGLFGKVRREKV